MAKRAMAMAVCAGVVLCALGCNMATVDKIGRPLAKDLTKRYIDKTWHGNKAVSAGAVKKAAYGAIDGSFNALLTYARDRAVKQAAVRQRPVVVHVHQNNTYHNHTHNHQVRNVTYRVEAYPRETVHVKSHKTRRYEKGKKVHYRVYERDTASNRERVVKEGDDVYISETDERVSLG